MGAWTWQKFADELGVSARQVRRWRLSEDFPVKRPSRRAIEIVQQWAAARPSEDIDELKREKTRWEIKRLEQQTAEGRQRIAEELRAELTRDCVQFLQDVGAAMREAKLSDEQTRIINGAIDRAISRLNDAQ